MKEILLSGGHVALVDDADYPALSRRTWRVQLNESGIRYAKCSVGRRSVYMHREITGATQGQQVDHRNGDGLNNVRSNLRICTHAENMRNKRSATGTGSRFKGVYHEKCSSMNPWTARIKYNGSSRFLGCFETEQRAAERYDVEAVKVFGDFAGLNFPRSPV